MGKIKTPPFTIEQVKDCLSSQAKTIKEITKELAKKVQKHYSEISGSFINSLRAILFSLVTSNSAKNYQNDKGEHLFALA